MKGLGWPRTDKQLGQNCKEAECIWRPFRFQNNCSAAGGEQ
jgi:hypothetical protein